MGRLRIDQQRVRALMDKEGIETLQQLAQRSGVHANTLTVIMRGGSWSAKTATALADALKCNPVDLLVAEGYPEPFSVAPVHP